MFSLEMCFLQSSFFSIIVILKILSSDLRNFHFFVSLFWIFCEMQNGDIIIVIIQYCKPFCIAFSFSSSPVIKSIKVIISYKVISRYKSRIMKSQSESKLARRAIFTTDSMIARKAVFVWRFLKAFFANFTAELMNIYKFYNWW